MNHITHIPPSGAGVENADPVTVGNGVRISFATAQPIMDAGITALSGSITEEDLQSRWNDINNLCNSMYWEPSIHAINYYQTQYQRPYYGVVNSGSYGFTDIQGSRSRVMKRLSFDPNSANKLAWQVYYTGDAATTRPAGAAYAYDEQMYNLLCGPEGRKAATDPGKWLNDLKALYIAHTGEASITDTMDALVGQFDGEMDNRFREFTWSSNSSPSAMGDPAQKVKWSSIGYLTTCVQFCWLAQEMGLADTYVAMANATARWVVSGAASDMPIILVEATSEVSLTTGGSDAEWAMLTLPAQFQQCYQGSTAERLFSKWPAEAEGNTDQAIASITNGLPMSFDRGESQIGQATGKHYENGIVSESSSYNKIRSYMRLLEPIAGSNLYGYFPNWTFWVDNPFGGPSPNPTPDPKNTLGSFTWKLNPAGVHDKTPDKEVNEPSIIYNLNLSQNGYNANNYLTEWEPYVRGDGIDCNKLRIRIYHVSENLAEEQQATKYARDAVKQKGADVTTPINKVTIGDGFIKKPSQKGNLSFLALLRMGG